MSLRYHFLVMFYQPDYTVADIKTYVIELRTRPRDKWLAENEYHLQVIRTLRKQRL